MTSDLTSDQLAQAGGCWSVYSSEDARSGSIYPVYDPAQVAANNHMQQMRLECLKLAMEHNEGMEFAVILSDFVLLGKIPESE